MAKEIDLEAEKSHSIDRALMARVQGGDTDAFETLVEKKDFR